MKNPRIKQMADDFIRSTKENISLEIADQVMDLVCVGIQFPEPYGTQLKDQIQLLILDAVEFGIQLGGMEWKEGE